LLSGRAKCKRADKTTEDDSESGCRAGRGGLGNQNGGPCALNLPQEGGGGGGRIPCRGKGLAGGWSAGWKKRYT